MLRSENSFLPSWFGKRRALSLGLLFCSPQPSAFLIQDGDLPCKLYGACSAGQPRPQGLLGVQNGDSEKTLANSSSRVHKLANHKAHCHFETIKISNIFWRHVTCCLQGSSPSRHFDRREDLVDEVAVQASDGPKTCLRMHAGG